MVENLPGEDRFGIWELRLEAQVNERPFSMQVSAFACILLAILLSIGPMPKGSVWLGFCCFPTF